MIAQILRQLKETMSTLLKKHPKNPHLDQDSLILLHLGLQLPVP